MMDKISVSFLSWKTHTCNSSNIKFFSINIHIYILCSVLTGSLLLTAQEHISSLKTPSAIEASLIPLVFRRSKTFTHPFELRVSLVLIVHKDPRQKHWPWARLEALNDFSKLLSFKIGLFLSPTTKAARLFKRGCT